MKGNFESFFKDKPSPLWGADEKQAGGDRTNRFQRSDHEDPDPGR